MANIKELIRDAAAYSGNEHSAFAVAESYKEGDESTTEYVCAGDPVYLVLIAVNILMEAAERLGVSAEVLEPLVENIRAGLLARGKPS